MLLFVPPNPATVLACRVWEMIRGSLLNSLWSSPASDAIEQQISRICPINCRSNAERGLRLQWYARALNSSFLAVSENM
jgi:hypothetical protein